MADLTSGQKKIFSCPTIYVNQETGEMLDPKKSKLKINKTYEQYEEGKYSIKKTLVHECSYYGELEKQLELW